MAERLTGRPHILYVVEKPCNVYKLYRNPYDNYMISLQSVIITGFLYNMYNIQNMGSPCESYSPFPLILQKKLCIPVNVCKYLQSTSTFSKAPRTDLMNLGEIICIFFSKY